MKLHPKTPVVFVLAMLLNILLVVALEAALFYRIPTPLTTEVLEKVSPRYENCRVYGEIGLYSGPGVHFYRVETQHGETDLIPLGQHSFFPSRSRLYDRKILENVDLREESSRQIMFGPNMYTIFISDGSVHAGTTGGVPFQQAALTKYIGLGAVLAFAQLLLLEKLRGN